MTTLRPIFFVLYICHAQVEACSHVVHYATMCKPVRVCRAVQSILWTATFHQHACVLSSTYVKYLASPNKFTKQNNINTFVAEVKVYMYSKTCESQMCDDTI